jgi:hypothetical protein
MIKNRDRAVALAKASEELIREIFRTVEPSPSGASFVSSEEIRRRLVQLIGKLEADLVGPLYAQYPDLEPHDRRKKPRA